MYWHTLCTRSSLASSLVLSRSVRKSISEAFSEAHSAVSGKADASGAADNDEWADEEALDRALDVAGGTTIPPESPCLARPMQELSISRAVLLKRRALTLPLLSIRAACSRKRSDQETTVARSGIGVDVTLCCGDGFFFSPCCSIAGG